MNLSAWSITDMIIFIAIVVAAVVGISTFLYIRKRRTAGLRTRFGGAEYDRAVEDGAAGGRRKPTRCWGM